MSLKLVHVIPLLINQKFIFENPFEMSFSQSSCFSISLRWHFNEDHFLKIIFSSTSINFLEVPSPWHSDDSNCSNVVATSKSTEEVDRWSSIRVQLPAALPAPSRSRTECKSCTSGSCDWAAARSSGGRCRRACRGGSRGSPETLDRRRTRPRCRSPLKWEK